MKAKRLLISILLLLFAAGEGHGQTSDYHLRVGASPVRDFPAQEIDMSGLDDVSYGPAEGKVLQVFVLWGAFGRRGAWPSKMLSRDIRAGKTNVLMFEDEKWQPLRPVGIRHGLEIPFGLRMGREMPGETVGIVAASGSLSELVGTLQKAGMAAPCRVVAFVQLRDASMGRLEEGEIRNFFGGNDIVVVDMTPVIALPALGLARPESAYGKGDEMAELLLKILSEQRKED